MKDPVHIARKRAKAKRGFYIHFTATLFIVGVLFLINILSDPFDMWFFWPLLGLSIPLGIHYLAAIGVPGTGKLDKEWEDHQTEKELARMGVFLEEEPQEDLELPTLQEKSPIKEKNRWGEQDLV